MSSGRCGALHYSYMWVKPLDGGGIVVNKIENATVEYPGVYSKIVRMAWTLKGNRTAPGHVFQSGFAVLS
jgi:hypothetical protein